MSAPAPQALYPSPARRLQVCLELGPERLPGWLAAAIEALAAADFIDLQLIRQAPAPASRPGLYGTYQSLDRRLLGALAPVLAPRAPVLPTIGASASTRAADVRLRVGLPPAPATAALANWSIAAEDCDPDAQGRWLLPAFLAGADSSCAGLRVHDDADGSERLLEPGEVAPVQLCFARHRAYQLQKAPAQLLRALRRLASGQPLRWCPAPGQDRFGPLDLLTLSLRLASRALARLGRRGAEHWQVAVRRDAGPLDPEAPDARGFQLLEPPAGTLWADPAPWQEQGRDWVLVEALDARRGIGEIHALALNADGVSEVLPLFAPPHHLSYPVLFRWQGELVLWAESAQARRVSAWRALDFPHRWEALPPVLPGWRSVDASPFAHDGRWWLFACVAESPFDDGGREWNELFLFHADSPLGPWTPHPQNPVCSDVRRARPAGPVFEHAGRLIRPGQDCSGDYGRAVVFHEILRLDAEVFEERMLGRLDADWAPQATGCHTYARCGGLEVLDAKYRGRPRPLGGLS